MTHRKDGWDQPVKLCLVNITAHYKLARLPPYLFAYFYFGLALKLHAKRKSLPVLSPQDMTLTGKGTLTA